MKEYDKALATYEAGLAHDPDSAELKEGVARCYEALDKVPASIACSHVQLAAICRIFTYGR